MEASPALIERHRKKATVPVAPETLERSIRELKAELRDISRRREHVWELNASGKVRDDDLQEHLDALGSRRDEAQAELAVAEERLSVAKASAARKRDVEISDSPRSRDLSKSKHST